MAFPDLRETLPRSNAYGPATANRQCNLSVMVAMGLSCANTKCNANSFLLKLRTQIPFSHGEAPVLLEFRGTD